MSKIPSVADGDQLISDLTKKDFVELQGGGHRRIQYISSGTEEITPVRTKISRGTKHSGDIPAHLLSKMARDLGITRKQLLELAECTLSQEEYEKHLRSLPRRPPSN